MIKLSAYHWYAAAITIVGIAAAGGAVIWHSQDVAFKQQQDEAKQQQDADRQQQLQDCLKQADDNYNSYYQAYGTKVTDNNGQVSYTIPGPQADRLTQDRRPAKDLCVKEYPIQ